MSCCKYNNDCVDLCSNPNEYLGLYFCYLCNPFHWSDVGAIVFRKSKPLPIEIPSPRRHLNADDLRQYQVEMDDLKATARQAEFTAVWAKLVEMCKFDETSADGVTTGSLNVQITRPDFQGQFRFGAVFDSRQSDHTITLTPIITEAPTMHLEPISGSQ